MLVTPQNINVIDKTYLRSPLHAALSYDKVVPEIVYYLIEKRASLIEQDRSKSTPLYQAIAHDAHLALLNALTTPQTINMGQVIGRTPLHEAARKMNLEAINFLIANGANLSAQDKDGFTPLDLAINDNANLEIIKPLLTPKTINLATSVRTPLHRAIFMGTAKVYRNENIDKNLNLILFLIEPGADLNAKDEDLHTPLYDALKIPNVEVIKKLITPDNINFPDITGSTPLHEAVAIATQEVVNLLINNGAKVNAIDNNNISVLDASAKRHDNAIKTAVLKTFITHISPEEVQHLVPAMIALTDPKNSKNIQAGLRETGLYKDARELIKKQLIPVIVDEKLALARKYKLNVPEAELRQLVEANINKVVSKLPNIPKSDNKSDNNIPG